MQLTLPLGIPSKLLQIRDCLLATYGPQRDVLRHDPTAVRQSYNQLVHTRHSIECGVRAFARVPAFLGSATER